MAAKLIRLAHKIAIQLLYHLQFLLQASSLETLETPSYVFMELCHFTLYFHHYCAV
jgi:hypothetical protein